MQNNQTSDGALEALEWYLDHGVDEVMGDEAVDRTAQSSMPMPAVPNKNESQTNRSYPPNANTQSASESVPLMQQPKPMSQSPMALGGASQDEVKALVADVSSLEQLQKTIADYDGIALKKTATNLVFADGNPKAKIMVVGEAPGADEDRQGKPFMGVSGQLLDKILAAIDLSRTADKPDHAAYISNIINWRPPGNRTPSPIEIEQSLPFIEKHIALVSPDYLIFAGGVAAKALMHTNDSISKLRGKFHDYVPQSLEGQKPIKAIATYHPAYLLRTPTQKRAVWHDMLMLQDAIQKGHI